MKKLDSVFLNKPGTGYLWEIDGREAQRFLARCYAELPWIEGAALGLAYNGCQGACNKGWGASVWGCESVGAALTRARRDLIIAN